MSLAKVLVVDDNETVLEMSKFVLRAAADDAGTASGAAQDLVIIAFTACAAEGDELGLRDAGFDGDIGKPVDVMTLAAEARFWLEGPASARASCFVRP